MRIMTSLKDKITFFYAIEEKLWDEKVDANKYFATLSILCIALLESWHTTGNFLESTFDWDVEMSVFRAIILLAYLWVINATESVFVCKDLKTAALRSFLILGAFILAYIAGVVLGLIIIAIVCIIMFVLLCYFIIGVLNGTLNTPQRHSSNKNDDPDMEMTNEGWVKKDWESMDGLEMIDTHCHHYSRNSIWETWKRDDI